MSVEIALSNEVNEERRLTPLTNKGPSKLKGPSKVNVPDEEETNRELALTNRFVDASVTKRKKMRDSSRVSDLRLDLLSAIACFPFQHWIRVIPLE